MAAKRPPLQRQIDDLEHLLFSRLANLQYDIASRGDGNKEFREKVELLLSAFDTAKFVAKITLGLVALFFIVKGIDSVFGG